MKFAVEKVIVPLKIRQQVGFLARFCTLIQNKFISKISYISILMHIYKYMYTQTHTYIHLKKFFST